MVKPLPYDVSVSCRWIIPMVPGPKGDYRVVLEFSSVLVKDGVIVDIIKTEDLDKYQIGERFVGSNTSLLIPGLINMHTHLPMSPLRSMFEDLPLIQWLDKIMPLENMLLADNMKERFMRIGTTLGIYESLINGTTCCNDMYYYSDMVLDLAEKFQFRLSTVSDPHGCEEPVNRAKALEERVECIRRAKTDNATREYAKAIAGFHGCYTSSKEYQTAVLNAANKDNMLIHIHCHETKGEIEMFRASDKCTAIERLKDLKGLSDRTILAHCVHLEPDEIKLLSKKHVNVVHNPRSNMKLGSGICQVRKLLDAGINVCLGTDSSSSNNSLSMVSEMQFATLLSKLATGDPSSLNAYDALKMATINGAKALKMEHKIGSLEKGKEFDSVLFELSPDGHDFPIIDPLDHLVYTNFGRVKDVFIKGDAKVRSGQLSSRLKIDWAEQKAFVEEALQISKNTKLSERVKFG